MKTETFFHPDLHLHSRCSDGTDSPEELLQNVRDAGVDIFSLTDHDAVRGCDIISDSLRSGDPAFITGVEFTCEDQWGRYHLLGYGYDNSLPAVRELVENTHAYRMQKAYNRIAFLKEQYGFVFTEEEELSLLSKENPGRPHFVALLLSKGLIESKEVGFALFKSYNKVDPTITPELAIDAILQSDGIPVLAHGILSDGSRLLSEEQINARVQRLTDAGLKGLECYYSSYTPEQQSIMCELTKRFDLLPTAGSDYHGKNKTVAIGETQCMDGASLQRFYEAIFPRIIRK